MNTAEFHVTIPFMASVCRIPTEAEELWMMPVTTAPVRMPRMGLFPSTEKAVEKIGALLYGAMEPDM